MGGTEVQACHFLVVELRFPRRGCERRLSDSKRQKMVGLDFHKIVQLNVQFSIGIKQLSKYVNKIKTIICNQFDRAQPHLRKRIKSIYHY